MFIGRNDPTSNVERRPTAFPFQSAALFRLEAILLGCFGAKVGRGVYVYPAATVYFPSLDESAVSEQAFVMISAESRQAVARRFRIVVIFAQEQTIPRRIFPCCGTDCDRSRAMGLCACVNRAGRYKSVKAQFWGHER